MMAPSLGCGIAEDSTLDDGTAEDRAADKHHADSGDGAPQRGTSADDDVSPDAIPRVTDPGQPVVIVGQGGAPPIDPDISDVCPSAGDFGLQLIGTDLDEFEGRTLWVSIMNANLNTGDDYEPPFGQLELTIDGGEVKVECPLALVESNYYPGVAVIIDADGDGSCGGEDLIYVDQRYAWASGVEDPLVTGFTAAAFAPIDSKGFASQSCAHYQL